MKCVFQSHHKSKLCSVFKSKYTRCIPNCQLVNSFIITFSFKAWMMAYNLSRACARELCARAQNSGHVTKIKASERGEESRACAFCSELKRKGTNMIVKGTAHTGMKDIRIKATVITPAVIGVSRLLKKKQKKGEQFHCSAVFWQ